MVDILYICIYQRTYLWTMGLIVQSKYIGVFMDYVTTFNNIVTILSLVFNIVSIPFLIKKVFNYFYKKRIIKKILGFTHDIVQISYSVRDIENENGNKNNYMTHDCFESINNIIKLLNMKNLKYKVANEINSNNEINIGGFLNNKKVNVYFTNYFKNFKYIVYEKNKSIFEGYPIDHSILEYSIDKSGFKIGNDIFEIKKDVNDYAFLIKLVKSDFKDNNKKAVHIIFGGGSMATKKATEYLLFNYKQIYKHFKKNHYFFALEINCIDQSINYSKGIINLTDRMFC